MTVATFFYKETPYRPLLVLTSAEEESGKTTALRLIRRLGYRILSATSVSSGSIHRVFDHYDANLSIDEAKANLREEPALVTALNNGFDEESAVVLRWDTDAGNFIPFRTDCFKIIAGIGSYLNHDTLSRSFVVTLERATAEEYAKVIDFAFCELSETQPIARKLLTWANAHREIFRGLVLEMMRRLPKQFRGRIRQKFSVLYALAAFAGNEWYQKLNQAASHMFRQTNVDDPLHHQLLADSCAILEEQRILRTLGDGNCKLKFVHRKGESEREFIETKILISLLLALPEGPWKAYGKNKKLLDANGFFFLLKNYGIRTSERIKIEGIVRRGLFCDVLLSLFARWNREREFHGQRTASGNVNENQPSPGDGCDGHGDGEIKDLAKTGNPPSPASPASQVADPEHVNPVTPLIEKEENTTGGVTEQVVEAEHLTSKVTSVTPDSGEFANQKILIRQSTAQAGFCIATRSELFVAIDLETFYPWDAEEQPKQSDPGQLKRRQKRGQAHPYAKDPRRCAIRFVTIHADRGLQTHDMFDGPIPDWIQELLRTRTILGHNLDFDVNVLRRYGVTISDSIRDTMLAARLLGLGRHKNDRDDIASCEVAQDDDGTVEEHEDDGRLYKPADNALDAVVMRYLGIQLPKAIARLGNSDWSVPDITELQREYVRWDVGHLPALWERLKSELANAKLFECFAERMQFFVNLHLIKMTGIPINTAKRDADREETARLKADKREDVRRMFSDFRAPVPKSRRKKVKAVKDSSGIPIISAPTAEYEEFNPNVPEQVMAALALHGIQVENAQKETLQKIKAPETELLLQYAEHKARLSAIDGIVRSTFPDDRVRAAGWNQLSARTGRTSVEPNLQNLPRKWRHAFQAPPDLYWLSIDLSQIEVYVIAVHTACERMISILSAGKDIYVETAAYIFGLQPVRGSAQGQVSELYRDAVKPLVLGINYGLTVYGFIRQVRTATGLEFSLQEAQNFFELFFELYPEIKAYHDRALEEAQFAFETRTILGQRRFLPPLKDDRDERTGYWPSLEYRKRILLNTPIQSGACLLLIRAVNRFLPRLPESVQPLNLVHDEFNGLAPKELLQQTYDIIAEEFDRTFKRFYGDRLTVKVSGYAGTSWADKTPLPKFLHTL
jgi:DNA polymerase I-like protein with 3'-5' exonuclease and polymerase domains